jgi:hypothetical protein
MNLYQFEKMISVASASKDLKELERLAVSLSTLPESIEVVKLIHRVKNEQFVLKLQAHIKN